MNKREQARKQAEVMLAYADGAEIESRISGQQDCMFEIDSDPSWNFCGRVFRVKQTGSNGGLSECIDKIGDICGELFDMGYGDDDSDISQRLNNVRHDLIVLNHTPSPEPEQVDIGSDNRLSERERFIAELSFKSGYESGHNDTVESQYGDSDEVAADMVQDMCLDGSYSDVPPPEPNYSKQVEELKAKIDNANMAASETARDWESRCYSIMAALGEDYGTPSINHTSKQVEVLAKRTEEMYLSMMGGQYIHFRDDRDWFDSDGKAIIPDAEPEYCECTNEQKGDSIGMRHWMKYCPTCSKQIKEVSDE